MKSLVTSSIKFLIIAATLATWLFVNAADAPAQHQRTLQLDILTATGGSVVNGSAVTGIFDINFGNVNGLGLGTPALGVTKTIQAGGTLYTTPITLIPRYLNFPINRSATISVMLDTGAGTADGRAAHREGATIASMTSHTATYVVLAAGLANNAVITRQVGFFVSNANGAGAATGSLSARLIYEIHMEK